MCVAMPGRIIKINKNSAEADFCGVKHSIFLDLMPSAKVNDYVLVHAGFAIQILDSADALKTLEAFKAIQDGK